MIYFPVSDPVVTVSSSPITPGSNVTVTCAVEFNQHVDVGLTVNIVLTGPVNISPTSVLMESTTRYTSSLVVSSFGREQSGVYECKATATSDTLITSSMEISRMERITVGKLFTVTICRVYDYTSIIIMHTHIRRCLPLPKGCGVC